MIVIIATRRKLMGQGPETFYSHHTIESTDISEAIAELVRTTAANIIKLEVFFL